MLKKIATGVLLVASFSSMPAMSATVHLAGDTVDFYYDDTQPGMSAYGTLEAVGDSIFATPTGFLAQSLNGGDVDFSALGTVKVVARSGYQFDAIHVGQQGDYKLSGAGASVSTSGNLTVSDSSNAAISNDFLLTSGSDFSIDDGQLHQWSSGISVDLNTVTWQGVSSIDLTLESILFASTLASGEQALIQNKFVGGGLVTVYTTPVPLPAAFWLMISGLFVLTRVTKKQ